MIPGSPPPTVERQPRSRQSIDEELDSLSAHWRSALDSAQRACEAAGAVLPPALLQPRAARLKSERVAAGLALESFAHDHDVDGWFSDLQVPRSRIRGLLGLPSDALACVFTTEGVLVGSGAIHSAAWAKTFDELLSRRVDRIRGDVAPFDPRTDYPAHMDGKPRLDGVRAFLASRGVRLPEGGRHDPPGTETVYGVANRKQAVHRRLLNGQKMRAAPGTRRYLRLARGVGLRIGVVCASTHSSAILANAGLTDLVDDSIDGIVMVAENLRSEPAPDALLAACRHLGVDPGHTVAFETSPAGVAAGASAHFELVVAIAESGLLPLLRSEGAGGAATSLEELLDRRLAATRDHRSPANRRLVTPPGRPLSESAAR